MKMAKTIIIVALFSHILQHEKFTSHHKIEETYQFASLSLLIPFINRDYYKKDTTAKIVLWFTKRCHLPFFN